MKMANGDASSEEDCTCGDFQQLMASLPQPFEEYSTPQPDSFQVYEDTAEIIPPKSSLRTGGFKDAPAAVSFDCFGDSASNLSPLDFEIYEDTQEILPPKKQPPSLSGQKENTQDPLPREPKKRVSVAFQIPEDTDDISNARDVRRKSVKFAGFGDGIQKATSKLAFDDENSPTKIAPHSRRSSLCELSMVEEEYTADLYPDTAAILAAISDTTLDDDTGNYTGIFR
jgi:hypothetical protein